MTGPAHTVIDGLVRGLSLAGAHDAAVETPPCCVLWPDLAREWEPAVALLRERLEVLCLGDYDLAASQGPAIWIRSRVDQTEPAASPPVVYLPGVERSTLRSAAELPPELQPLLELQYRGATFAHRNGRDWTILAFLSGSDRGALDIPVVDDVTTRRALLAARERVFVQTIDRLRAEAPLKASFFNELLAPDVIADILAWISDEAVFNASHDEDGRLAFIERARSQLNFDTIEGTIAAARKLGDAETEPWQRAWNRYKQAPMAYPGIENRLRAARPKKHSSSGLLFDRPGTWPQDNEEDERRLREALVNLLDVPAGAARVRVLALESDHSARRDWVWAKLRHAPLASALAHLADVAQGTKTLSAGSLADQIESYVAHGWRTDEAVLDSLSAVTSAADTKAVEAAIQAMYRDWLEASAKQFQAAARTEYVPSPAVNWPDSTCLIFLDGMRLDIGHALADRLNSVAAVEIRPYLAALPTITATSKAAISPGAARAAGSAGLGPSANGSTSELTADGLRKLITAAGWQVLSGDETGDSSGQGWTEMGDLDELGHKQAPKLAQRIGLELDRVAERVAGLLAAGWCQVAVVTDHGWLFLPGGLPKVQIPAAIAETNQRKGRCARLKAFADYDGIRMPWFWDSKVEFAMAPGIACFEAGRIYEHGGLSLQECVTPIVIARGSKAAAGEANLQLHWRGLWAEVSAERAPLEARVDIRSKAGDSSASVLLGGPIGLSKEGSARAIADDRYVGTEAFAVLLDETGNVISQLQTTVGGV